ncbi:hypothetical protein, partial [Geobacillus sp. ZGt-1]|uniref:hypothetical protein n=1 Tax=Geobacillus sp. ZGt-1 TaxID=1631556 RepID=UPI001F32F25C
HFLADVHFADARLFVFCHSFKPPFETSSSPDRPARRTRTDGGRRFARAPGVPVGKVKRGGRLIPSFFILNVQVFHITGIFFDELAARLNFIAH